MAVAAVLSGCGTTSEPSLRNAELTRGAALYFACFGVYLLMGVITFIFWKWLRRDLPMLALSVLCMLMAIHSVAISGTLSVIFPAAFPSALSAQFGMVAYALLNGLVACMLWAFFPHAFYPRASSGTHIFNSAIAALAVMVSAILAVAAVTVEALDPILSISRLVKIALMAVVAILGFRTLGSPADNRLMTVSGLGLLLVGGLHDALLIGAGGRPYVLPFAFLGFVLIQSYVMIRRTAEATLRAQVSGKRLRREVEARTKELRKASDAAQTANLAKTEFVTAVTHELRTPLASMLGYLELLRDELDGVLNETQIEFFDTLEESGERLLNLVNKLLDLARIESGRIDLKLEPLNAGEIVEQVRNELYPLAKEKRLYLRKDVGSEDVRLMADEQWLSVVLTDLVSNAIKYTREGGVTIRVAPHDAKTAIEVSDTGAGISDEFMPHLFERFSREDHACDGAPTGTGLGLTIARELLNLMNGEIFVDSEIGRGSTFRVLLPVPESDETQPVAEDVPQGRVEDVGGAPSSPA